MFASILDCIILSISSCSSWLSIFLDSIGSSVVVSIFAAFLIYTVVRLLLRPFIGAAFSDLATRGLQEKKAQRNRDQRQQSAKKGG